MDPAQPDDRALDQVVARKLKVTWDAFYAQHGRLREAQRNAAIPILEGQNVLITAPTASGKTEAAVVPLIERFHSSRGPWMVVYIIPTRALVNDLYHRLYGRCQQIGVHVVRRTGEYKSISAPPHILLTTPESFDSMLCRGRSPGGHFLMPTKAVVLDEIHLLAETARGEQVRWLLERLRRLKNFGHERGWSAESSVQIVALSASLQDPDDVVRRFLREGQIIRSSGQRSIEQIAPEEMHRSSEDRLPAALDDETRKFLHFCNQRERVDELCSDFKNSVDSRYEVAGHHGSLSKSLREDSEQTLKEADRVVAVSTSTLEIGIDIGDIDVVGLDEPAHDISALLQRIGRGNRRTATTKVLCCSRKPHHPILHEAMLYCAEQGKFGGGKCGTQFAAAIQQLASFIFQSPNRHRQKEALVDFARSMLLDEELASDIVNDLIDSGAFECDASGVKLGEDWTRKAELGEIHSVIEETAALDIRDADTGKLIAKSVANHRSERIAIVGMPLTIHEQVGRTIHVRQTHGTHDNDHVKYQPTKPSPKASQPYAVRTYLGLESNEWPLIEHGGCFYLFHLHGFPVEILLRLNWPKEFRGEVTPFAMLFPNTEDRDKPKWLSDINAAETRRLIYDNVDALEFFLARPRANRQLSKKTRAYEVASWLNVEETVASIKQARINLNPTSHQISVLSRLLS